MIFRCAQDSYFTAEHAEDVKQGRGMREEEEEEKKGVSTIYTAEARGGPGFTHWHTPEIQFLEESTISPGDFLSHKLKQYPVSSQYNFKT
jgi:hypothetical protein